MLTARARAKPTSNQWCLRKFIGCFSEERPNVRVQPPRARRSETYQKTYDLAREAVGCNHLSRRAVTSHERNPLASPSHPLLSYHDDQQLRPPRQLEHVSPCCNLVPRHPRLAHWWHLV